MRYCGGGEAEPGIRICRWIVGEGPITAAAGVLRSMFQRQWRFSPRAPFQTCPLKGAPLSSLLRCHDCLIGSAELAKCQ